MGLVVGSLVYAEVQVLVEGKGRIELVWHATGGWEGRIGVVMESARGGGGVAHQQREV